jgi:hypothetical protein
LASVNIEPKKRVLFIGPEKSEPRKIPAIFIFNFLYRQS